MQCWEQIGGEAKMDWRVIPYKADGRQGGCLSREGLSQSVFLKKQCNFCNGFLVELVVVELCEKKRI